MSRIDAETARQNMYLYGTPTNEVWWTPNTMIATSGDWVSTDVVPGFWSTAWKSQVGSMIDNTWFGDAIGWITSPFQTYEANTAADNIFTGLMEGNEDVLSQLRVIENDPTKTGKDWYDILPQNVRSELDALGVTPNTFDYSADVFARDLKQSIAWSVYNRDVAAGYDKYNDAGLLLGSLGLGIVTDPTSIISAGLGSAAKVGAKSMFAKLYNNFGFKSNLVMNAGLTSVQTVDSMVSRDYISERLGMTMGDYSASDVISETLMSASIGAAIGSTLYAAGYYGSMGLSKISKKTSKTAKDIASGLVNNPNILSEEEYGVLLNKVSEGQSLTIKEQIPILAEVLNSTYGSKFDVEVWDWEAMEVTGLTPLGIATRVLTEGYSGKQITQLFENAYKVIDDASKISVPVVGPIQQVNLVNISLASPESLGITGPILPIRDLPDYVKAAGYVWGPIGDIVKDPNNPIGSEATGQASVQDSVQASVQDSVQASVQDSVQASEPVKQPLLPEIIESPTTAVVTLTGNRFLDLVLEAENLIKKKPNLKMGLLIQGIIHKIRSNNPTTIERALITKFIQGARDAVGMDDIESHDYSKEIADLKAAAKKTDNASVKPKKSVKDSLESIGLGSTLITYSPPGSTRNYSIEMPSAIDRLIWATGIKWPNKGEAEKILKDNWRLTPAQIRQKRSNLSEAIQNRSKDAGKIDRIRVTKNNETYSVEVLRIAKSTAIPAKTTKIDEAAKQAKVLSKVEKYVNKRNEAVKRALDKARTKAVSKTENNIAEKQNADVGVKGMEPKLKSQYLNLLKIGHLNEAYALLTDFNVGEGNFKKIKDLSDNTYSVKFDLDEAIRTGSNPDRINEIKKEFDALNAELEKTKQRLFAVSPTTNFGKLRLVSPLDIQKGALGRGVLGTPYAPSTQFYVEPVTEDAGEATHKALALLDRAFILADMDTVVSKIDTDLPSGFLSSVGEALTKLNSHLFLQSDTGRLLYNKIPIVGRLVNFPYPSTLSNATDLGSTKMSPSLASREARIEAEGLHEVRRTIKRLKDIKVRTNTEQLHKAMLDAMRERHAGIELSSTSNRTATNILKDLLRYFDRGSEEGLAVGKIKKSDPTYNRITLNEYSRRHVVEVGDAYHDAAIEAFSAPDSKIHTKTLESVTAVHPVDSDGKKVENLGELLRIDPDVAKRYLHEIRTKGPKSPLYNFAHQAMKVRMGLDVTDDKTIIRKVSSYLNSGIGKKLDAALLLDKRMSDFIETDPYRVINEYNRNVRYSFVKQDAVNRFLSDLTGQHISGITFADMLNYFKGKLKEHYAGQEAEIDKIFTSLVKKEMQITNRSIRNVDTDSVMDAVLSFAAAPVQVVVTGLSFAGSIVESAKAFGSALMTSLHGPGGSKAFMKNLGGIIRSMSKGDALAGMAGVMDTFTHGQLYEVDIPVMNYRGSYLGTKFANVVQPIKNIGSAFNTPTPSGKSSRVANVIKATSNAMVEPVRQLMQIDALNAINYRSYHTQGMYRMAEVIEKIIQNKDFYKKDQDFKNIPRSEMINRMEEAGLFSTEALVGLRALIHENPGLFSKAFTTDDLYAAVLKVKENDPKITRYKYADRWVKSFLSASDRFADSRIMNVARLWDRPNIDTQPALNRFMNTFSGYSRWFFSRHMMQNFPNSSYHKIGALLAWYSMAELAAVMIRDFMLDHNKFNELLESDDDELFDNYVTYGILRVPLFGQLTNMTVEGASRLYNFFAPEEDQIPTTYLRPSMFAGTVYWNAVEEMSKAAKGEDYDPEKIRKVIPILNAPPFAGILKSASQE